MRNLGLLFGLIVISLGGFVFWSGTPDRYIAEANANLTSGKVAKSIEILNEGYNRFPDNEKICFLLAKSFLLSGEVEDASKIVLEKKLYNSLSNKEEFQDFLVDLAEANNHQGNLKESTLFAKKYITIIPQNEASKRIVQNYIKIGQVLPEDSVKLWENAFNIASALKDKELKESVKALLLPKYLQQVKDLQVQNMTDQAFEVLDRAKVLGKNADVNLQEALLYKSLGKMELAGKKFEEALQLDSENEEYKLAYAEALEEASEKEQDKEKKKEYSERIKLLIGDGTTDPKKASLLNKIINANAKFKILDGKIQVTKVGDYSYPDLSFKIKQLSDTQAKSYRIIFFEGISQIDIYESPISEDELEQSIEITSRNPISEDKEASVRIYVNKEFVSELKAGKPGVFATESPAEVKKSKDPDEEE